MAPNDLFGLTSRKLRFTVRLYLFLANLFCRIFGHRKQRASVRNIGVLHCARCRHITDQLTVRRRETKGDMERMMERVAFMTGYTFIRINWSKRLVHFRKPNGQLHIVPVGGAMRA